MSTRFHVAPAADLRRAIRDADGVEVFAIGEVENGQVVRLEVAARGRLDRVNALMGRARPGQVVIHNHPSGNLLPSDADLALAGRYGEDGVGFVIVDSGVTRARWVVEPSAPKEHPVDPERVRAWFYETLPTIVPDAEVRAAQVEMAERVATSFGDAVPLLCEAGTGTGKSLAYLVPAAIWAMDNDRTVVVSTYTRALQVQLASKDLPLLERGGLGVRWAVLQGRSNYVCKRRLAIADQEEHDGGAHRDEVRQLLEWSATSLGERSDLPLPLNGELWDRIASDTDLTLRLRCPHYASCHYYTARRRAAGAHLVVVNHALLLADRALRDAGGQGVLPRFDRLVIDEAHHLEDAATGALAQQITATGIRRALGRLLGSRRPGAAARVVTHHASRGSALPPEQWTPLETRAASVVRAAERAREEILTRLEGLASDPLDPRGGPLRIRVEDEERPVWTERVAPEATHIAIRLDEVVASLDAVLELFDDRPLSTFRAQSVLDLRRARRRLVSNAQVCRSFLHADPEICRWIEPRRTRQGIHAALATAPVEIAPVLRRLLWHTIGGVSCTSATLTVHRRFTHWRRQCGLSAPDDDVIEAVFPSPFDHATQALLALPRDLPSPEHSDFLQRSASTLVDAVRASKGGAFVLCTSYEAIQFYTRALKNALPPSFPVLAQQGSGQGHLIDRFRENPHSVLVGTDTFWEGVSVKGDGLRMIVIPRIPFRVPTDPLEQARYEAIRNRGANPFQVHALPRAVLKLRQGYGRLLRHRADRGVVLLLDRRLHDRPYGRILLRSLPPARRVAGPWRRVHEEIGRFFSMRESTSR